MEIGMKKLSFQILCCLLALFIFPLSALEVDRDELNTIGSDTVVFINYTGPQNVVQTKSQIAEIVSLLKSGSAPVMPKFIFAEGTNKEQIETQKELCKDCSIYIFDKSGNYIG